SARRPAYPTLFPYTTLFRSCPRWEQTIDQHPYIHHELPLYQSPRSYSPLHRVTNHAAPNNPVPKRQQIQWLESISVASSHNDWEDRKSTRLNSSHVKISYAV